VSPDVVLTVRHCISRLPGDAPTCDRPFEDPAGQPNELWVATTPFTVAGAAWKNVKSWVVPESREVCGNDIALLVLSSPVIEAQATPATPVLTEAGFREAVAARTMGIAAYGASSASGGDQGLRRSRFDIPVQCVPGNPAFACGGALEYIDVREFTGGAGPCTGDSGGGAVPVRDRGRIFGVLSRGNLSSGKCAEGIFERTDVWGWLIARTVLEAAPSADAAPGWARAAFPDAPKSGEYCRSGGCEAGHECVSFDGRRSFVCAARCDAGACSEGFHCESQICAPGAPPADDASGCSVATASGSSPVARGRSASLAPVLAMALAGAMLAIAAVRRARRAH